MRILADENIPRCVVEALRRENHDAAWVPEDAPGAADHKVLARAHDERRLLLTFDKDFGELAFRKGLPASSCGVILLRGGAVSPARLAEKVAAVPRSRSDWAGHFSVIEEDRVRMTPLPAQKGL
jgi:predicted nuclease of predicted toxin-antitoxin system